MITVLPLRFLPGNKWVHIRELCGKDEQSIAGTRSIDAICLLDQLIQDFPQTNQSITHSAFLPVADRGRLMMAVYFNTYGLRIENTVTCPSCSSRFDLSFTMDEWVDDLTKVKPESLKRGEGDYPFKAPGGVKFRLPTGEDEIAVMGMEPKAAEAELLRRCLQDGTRKYDPELLQKTMHEIAPLADAEFEARCPECSRMQWLHFDLQQYLLSSLLNERNKLVNEIHLLSKAYGWGLTEILELPRSTRRSFIAFAVTS